MSCRALQVDRQKVIEGVLIRGIYGGNGGVILNNSTIEGNTAQGQGGGVYAFDSSITLLGDSGVENNSPDNVYNTGF